ncbi:MAG TPA: hypothetical protein VEQ37_13605 [Actinomycetota bacterium]|nr:hypothetical protein [Actinomycetota bacterium]
MKIGETDRLEDWREVAGRVRLMRKAPVLRGLSRELLNELALRMRKGEVEAGEVLYRRFYVIESGRLAGTVKGTDETWYFEAGQSIGDAAPPRRPCLSGHYHRGVTIALMGPFQR